MDQKYRLCGKTLFFSYPIPFPDPEKFKSLLFLKFQKQEIENFLIVFEEKIGVFVYIQLSKKSRAIDTTSSSFFDVNNIRGKYKTIKNFAAFLDEVTPLLKGRKIYQLGSENLCEDLNSQIGVKEHTIVEEEDEVIKFLHFQEISTNYSSCRSPSSGIPSKENSLTSGQEKIYQERILTLEQENLQLRTFYEEERLTNAKKFENLQNQMNVCFQIMQKLKQENEELRNKINNEI